MPADPNTWLLWTLLGVAAMTLVAVTVVLASPPAGRGRGKKRRPLYEMTSWSNADMAAAVHQASDEQLCRIWRITGDKLRTDRFPSTIGMIAEIRRLVLDELAERDPEGFARWLAGRPHSTDPQVYLRN
ncbi:hypothetical protein [Flindersiella endophytica]